MSPRRRPSRRPYSVRLARKLKRLAIIAIDLCRASMMPGVVVATAAGRLVEATVTLTLLSMRSQPSAEPPRLGDHYSPLEASIVAAVAEAAPSRLLGKEIARRIGAKHNTVFRAILRNLVDKGALVHDSRGYGLPPAAAQSRNHAS